MPPSRGSLKHGSYSGSTCPWQVHRPPHTAKRGLLRRRTRRLSPPSVASASGLGRSDTTRPQAGRQSVERTRHEWNLRGLYRQRPDHGRHRRGRVRLLAGQPAAPRRGDHRAGRRTGRAHGQGRRAGRGNEEERGAARGQGARPRTGRRCRTPGRRAAAAVERPRTDADAPRRKADRAPRRHRAARQGDARPGTDAGQAREGHGGGGGQVRSPRGRPAARIAARGGPDGRRGQGNAHQADGSRRQARCGQPREAPRHRGPRDGGPAGPAAHHRSHPAQRRRTHDGDHRLGGRPAERRPQGPDHRARRSEHPRAGDRHRGGPHRRRHAGGDHPVGVRPVPAGDREAGHRAPHRRRPHPPRPHRRGGREGEGGDSTRRSASRAKRRPSNSACTTCTRTCSS